MIEAIAILALLGAALGSFAALCICRIPQQISIMSRRSFCSSCGHVLAWFELIPILSYLLLRGRCRHCGRGIPARDVLVELICAAMVPAVFFSSGYTLAALVQILFLVFLLIVALIDLRHLTIPNQVLLIGFCILAAVKVCFFTERCTDAAVASLAAGGTAWLVAFVGRAWLRREALGMGDVKFAALLGFQIGFPAFLFCTWLAALLGIGYAAFKWLSSTTREPRRLPFGSFLALSTAVWTFAPAMGYRSPIELLLEVSR